MAATPSPNFFAKLGAEFIGTFALVFAGCGAIMVNSQSGALGHVGVALTFGLVVAVMIYAVGHISAAHFNPAVTLAFASAGHFPWREVPGYVIAQCLAATLAIGLLHLGLGETAAYGATRPQGEASQASRALMSRLSRTWVSRAGSPST